MFPLVNWVVPCPCFTTFTSTPQCFSSIVGPNGSGKSNVIDSLLFVFGKRASKIRLKKVCRGPCIVVQRSYTHVSLSVSTA